VAPSDILFVSSGGAGDCSKAAPCGAIQTALAKVSAGKKKWIKVGAGMYFEALTVSGVAVEIVGTGATVLPRAVGVNLPGALVENGASATFRGLDFSGASGGASADGVLCAGSVATPTRVTLRQVTLDSNGQYGLDAMNCVVDLERSLVTRNQGGGVALFACDFTLANNFIVNNGLATATFGGVNILRDPPSGAGAGLLAFNTIARNSEPAVKCSDQVTTLTFADDIVFGNGTTQVVNSGAKCMWKYSDIAPMPVGGTGNIGTDPMFVNPEADDYHLAAGSPCVNTADPAATVDIDFDGDPRPAQGRADMGADEVP